MMTTNLSECDLMTFFQLVLDLCVAVLSIIEFPKSCKFSVRSFFGYGLRITAI